MFLNKSKKSHCVSGKNVCNKVKHFIEATKDSSYLLNYQFFLVHE